MKKIALLLLASLFTVDAQAFCTYKDYFHLNDEISPKVHIVSANSNQGLQLNAVGPRSFELKNNKHCETGYARVIVAYDVFNLCILDIKDGPYMLRPTISASCNGMRFIGLSTDGSNHSYTINLH